MSGLRVLMDMARDSEAVLRLDAGDRAAAARQGNPREIRMDPRVQRQLLAPNCRAYVSLTDRGDARMFQVLRPAEEAARTERARRLLDR